MCSEILAGVLGLGSAGLVANRTARALVRGRQGENPPDDVGRGADVGDQDAAGVVSRTGGVEAGLAGNEGDREVGRTVALEGRPVSQSRPDGRSMATMVVRAAALIARMTAFSGGRTSPEKPVPNTASTTMAARSSTARAAARRSVVSNGWHSRPIRRTML